MVAGVGSVDVALLAVAADDGWMPQTEEHLQILAYQGVTRERSSHVTKIDLVPSPAAAMGAVRAALQFSPFESAPIIPTSIITGEGFDALKTALARVLVDAPPPLDVGKPRLPIDRVFALRGIGTVVTGTLTGGALRRGEPLVVQPSGREAHARALQNHGRDVETSLPGTRTAINLPELDATGQTVPGRGEVITRPGLGDPSSNLDVLLTRSDRTDPLMGSRSKPSGSRPLKDGTHVRVYQGSGSWTARVHLLERESLLPGGRMIARLRFDSPVFVFAGDRFIVRDGAERATIAGGIILDPEPGRRALRLVAQRRFLERRAVADHADPAEAIAAWLERDRVIQRMALLRRSLFSEGQISESVAQLAARGAAMAVGDFVADAAWWKTIYQRASDLIDTLHRSHPERVGLPLSQLRSATEREFARHRVIRCLGDRSD